MGDIDMMAAFNNAMNSLADHELQITIDLGLNKLNLSALDKERFLENLHSLMNKPHMKLKLSTLFREEIMKELGVNIKGNLEYKNGR